MSEQGPAIESYAEINNYDSTAEIAADNLEQAAELGASEIATASTAIDAEQEQKRAEADLENEEGETEQKDTADQSTEETAEQPAEQDQQENQEKAQKTESESLKKFLKASLAEFGIGGPGDEELMRSIQSDLSRHLEILRKEDPEKELRNLVAVHLWKDVINTVGITEIVGEKNDQTIVDALHNAYYPAILPNKELDLLNQVNQENITPYRLVTFLSKTLGIVNDDRGQEEWKKIQEAYSRHYSQKNLEKLNRRLKQLIRLLDNNEHLEPIPPEEKQEAQAANEQPETAEPSSDNEETTSNEQITTDTQNPTTNSDSSNQTTNQTTG